MWLELGCGKASAGVQLAIVMRLVLVMCDWLICLLSGRDLGLQSRMQTAVQHLLSNSCGVIPSREWHEAALH
jgi:hypothetical protein